MTIIEAIFFGVIQGLTEFLPISSSGHLVVLHHFFPSNMSASDELAFDVALHIGTIIPVFFYFWKEWQAMAQGVLKVIQNRTISNNPDFTLFIQLIIASIPGALAGILLEKYIENRFRSALLVAVMMLIMGTILFIADRYTKREKDIRSISWKDVLMIGFSQALALIPGVSRSGITMTTGLFCRLTRRTAAKFSFLLLVPITLGAALKELPKLVHHGFTPDVIAGILTAACVGWLAIVGLLKLVEKYSFLPFVVYRYLFGILVLILILVK
jgi:undecaprenyl-diphosphatase